MAEAQRCKILTACATIVDRQKQQKVTLVPDGDEQVLKLKRSMRSIQAVLNDAEKRQVKEEAIQIWLENLRDVSYDIEDVLDEWNTALIEIAINAENDEESQIARRSYAERPDITLRIKEMNDKLDEIAREKDVYNLKADYEFRLNPEELQRLKSTSFVNVSLVLGRDDETEVIVAKLFDSCSEESSFDVMSIVGMGGIGKTTLAQRVYSDARVKNHFAKRIWVCVSDPFDDVQVARSIAESLNVDAHKLSQLQPLLECINESIATKKFLLVLDDVWTEDYNNWESLLSSLQTADSGSKILVTTRNMKVAEMIGSTYVHVLGKLSKEDSWKLFCQVAFFRKGAEERENLEELGRRFVERCQGLPLALKVIGSHLRLKSTQKEWQNVLDSEIWVLDVVQKGIFRPLMLSYYDLSSPIKRCFTYCSVFPKDHVFETKVLIKLWMSQGYLDSSGGMDMETVGQEYFGELVMRSFFQDLRCEEDDGMISTCKMHDIVHDFSQFLAKKECMVVDITRKPDPCTITSSDTNFRHLSVLHATSKDDIISIIGLQNLHTLMVSTSIDPGFGMGFLFCSQHLNFLKALDLSKNNIIEVPEEIGQLRHLRYLDLSDNNFKRLPETIWDLYNLQTLRLNNCNELEEMSKGIERLINLRHFEIYWRSVFPKGIGQNRSLQTLHEFRVCRSENGEAANLGDLKELNNLQGSLSIKWLKNVPDRMEAVKAELQKKRELNTLELDFFCGRGIKDEDDVIKGLQPCHNLKSLTISFYDGKFLPSWISLLSNLRKLLLTNCNTCEELPPLGNLPLLEWFEIDGMESLKIIGREYLGIHRNDDNDIQLGRSTEPDKLMVSQIVAFPKLRYLVLQYLDKWEEWKDVDIDINISIFPCLNTLRICNCPKLKQLPRYIQRECIQEVNIWGCPFLDEEEEEEEE